MKKKECITQLSGRDLHETQIPDWATKSDCKFIQSIQRMLDTLIKNEENEKDKTDIATVFLDVIKNRYASHLSGKTINIALLYNVYIVIMENKK